uniref:Uncharacterized protein n=1 Tax=Chlamydomonas euryale TaxID=1486919 RepID=A0A7R9VPG6_9CHLO|eukprot:362928-Chlamydomonas_euryale.AAC.6
MNTQWAANSANYAERPVMHSHALLCTALGDDVCSGSPGAMPRHVDNGRWQSPDLLVALYIFSGYPGRHIVRAALRSLRHSGFSATSVAEGVVVRRGRISKTVAVAVLTSHFWHVL